MEIAPHHTDWLLWILMLGAGLMLAARLYNPVRFAGFVSLPFHVKRREMELSFNPVVARGLFDVSLSVLSYLLLSLGIYVLLHNQWQDEVGFNDPALYFRILLILVLFYLLKNLMGLVVGWIFGQTEDIARIQNAQLAHRAWLAVILMPVLVLAIFNVGNYVVWYVLVMVLIIAGILSSLYFSFLQVWRVSTPAYYKIFYLCALEITPLLFLVEWLKSLIQ